MINIKKIYKASLCDKTLYTLFFITLAVALPQLVHTVGKLTATGSISGEVLLPMHAPVMLAGFFAGPIVGGIVGVFAPLLSFALSGMPSALMLPFMMVELCVYGVIAGLLSNIKLNNLLKVILVQLGGRFVKAIVLIISVVAFSYSDSLISTIYLSVITGLLGIFLQMVIVPTLLNKFNKNV